MKHLIAKAAILLEALPYLQKFRRKTFVIKLGGSTMEDRKTVTSILRNALFLENAGIRIVIVHGGGKAITKALKKSGVETQFVNGLRVTDKATMQVVERVMVREINRGLIRTINKLGGDAAGFSAADNGVLQVKKQFEEVEENGVKSKVDLGFVGKITQIFTHPIYRLLNVEKIPVIAPLGLGLDGYVYNINADVAACEIAARLKAEKLIFISDVDGILQGEKLISTVRAREVKKLIRKKVITGGMIPKSLAMVKAIKSGVGKTHIINGKTPNSLLLEIYTDSGIGTELVP